MVVLNCDSWGQGGSPGRPVCWDIMCNSRRGMSHCSVTLVVGRARARARGMRIVMRDENSMLDDIVL
jgi:hypothetical protein